MRKERARKRELQQRFEEAEKQKCFKKKTYKDRKTAKTAAKRLNKFHDFCQKVYKCPYCGFYHLSTDKGKVKEKEEKMYKREKFLNEEERRSMLDSLCEEYVIASRQAKVKQDLSSEIKDICGKVGTFETINHIITITETKGGLKFDLDYLRSHYPKVYDECCVKVVEDSLKLGSVKKKETPIEFID